MTLRQFALTSLLSSLMALPLGAQNAITRSLFDPDLYPALNGGFDLILQSGDTLAIDTSALTITRNGASLGTGVVGNTAGPTPQAVALFTFTNLTIPTGVTVTLTGTRPLGLLARRDMSIGSSLNLAGAGGAGRIDSEDVNPGPAGKLGGGKGGDSDAHAGTAGTGPGAGQGALGEYAGGGGAGHGALGSGGAVQPGATSAGPGGVGGSTYSLAAVHDLFGGSGGGGASGDVITWETDETGGSGGAGGGALVLIAQNNLTLTGGNISANGGSGGAGDGADWDGGGGGGSGGSVVLAAPVIQHSSGNITATGGAGGSTAYYVGNSGPPYYFPYYNYGASGGSGAGGRVALYSSTPPVYANIYTGNGSFYRSTVDEPAFAFPAALTAPAAGSPGLPDSTFSSEGLRVTPFLDGATQRAAEGRGVLVLGDGRIVVTGNVHNGADNDFGLACCLADGTLDPAFGTGGTVRLNFGSHEGAYAAALQPDGKILVGGDAFNGSAYDGALARFNADGSPDTSFSGDGRLTLAMTAGNELIADIAVQPDGKIVVAGFAVVGGELDFAVARFLPNGDLDTGFDGDGWRTLALSAVEDQATSVALLPDGRILLGGWKRNGGPRNFVLTRLMPSGATDTAFGTGGVVDLDAGGDDGVRSLALQRDGKILACGFVTAGASYDMAFLRLLPDGAADTTFGTAGKVVMAMGTGYDDPRDILVQADGRIVAVGVTNNGAIDDMAVLRFNTDGTLDATFDGDGRLVLAPGTGNDRLFSVALAPDGDIVAAGSSDNAGGMAQFALIRLLGLPEGLLVNGGFEAGEALGGWLPTGFGDWAQDQAATVGAENGITPYDGTRMLKFLGTGLTGAGAGTASDVVQYVDLSSYAAQVATGNMAVTVTARVNRVPGNAGTDSEFGLYLSSRSGSPGGSNTFTNDAQTLLTSDGDPATWEFITVTLDIPEGSTYLVVDLLAGENVVNNTTAPEFDGHYLDGVALTVIPPPALITFPALPARSAADAPFTLPATSSNGLPVSYQIVSGGGVATLSGNTVTLTGTPGSVTVVATQAGGNGFAAAAPVTRTFVVSNTPGFVKLASNCEASHTMGIRADGTLWGWG